ncbi:vitamin K epoxide reductase family protein [Kitasatospora sp. NBC_01287]|uniref:vitamin K epoxide reductase family protein n=1 Tax=Kitasatospora sp. NBC_01287 TaxID=2903573 RepID=UPI00225B19C5|nr:vitamin K epoxide reductase family protein [Kitasatospora sp. NBC_01287]MCX4749888.1 vitamin K epoxide reductase family protein [Kitasatospora sp. NBC_01287]
MSAALATGARQEPVTRPGPGRAFAWLLVVAGALGLAASAILTIDKFELLKNPHTALNCNINPVIACGSVMTSHQASAFGFPNSLLGLVGFAVVLATGAGMLAGARYRRWYWLGLQLGTTLGLALIHWLISQSLYSIGALCPYCMVVWTVTIALFWYTTLANLRTGVIPVGERLKPVVRELNRYHWVVPVLWYAVIALMILGRFWYYWKTLL